MRTQLANLLVVSAWLALVGAGFAALALYSNTPGDAGLPAPIAPAGEAGRRIDKPWRLAMAVHPRCPCTLASIAELDRLMARVGGSTECVIYVFAPGGEPTFADTHVRRNAERISGCTVRIDAGGAEALRLGIETSGGVVLYDAAGVPRFHGGVTPSRGHEGPSPGADAIEALVLRGDATIVEAPVFGCPLRKPTGAAAPRSEGE